MTGKSSSNRSVIRALQILKAFRPGSEVLGNGDIADLTGLPRATISRLTQTMVEEGFLLHDASLRAYRLGAPVLSLAFSMRNSSAILRRATPLMEALARQERINVGLALADVDEMVYLESIRLGARASIRTVMPGQRIPMETTSLGRAWMSTLDEPALQTHFRHFASRHPAAWPQREKEIRKGLAAVKSQGYCVASWLPDVVAVACPLNFGDGEIYGLNASLTTEEPPELVAARLGGPLLSLQAQLYAQAA